MQIEDMDIKDLKALAYDISINMQKSQQDIMVINQEIMRKQQLKSREIIDDTKIDIKEKKQ